MNEIAYREMKGDTVVKIKTPVLIRKIVLNLIGLLNELLSCLQCENLE